MTKKKIKKNLKFRILLCLIFAILFAGIFFFEPQIYNLVNNTDKNTYKSVLASDMVVHFIDVGQGDSIAVELPDDKIVLIDSGTTQSKTSLISYLKTNVLKNGSKNIDYFIITHPHEDHIGGAVAIFENFNVLNFFRPTVYTEDEKSEFVLQFGQIYADSLVIYNTAIFNSVIISAKNEDCETVFFSFLDLPVILESDYSLTFLTPAKMSYENVNNYSPMLLLEYSDKKVLFTGDAEVETENEYLGLGLNDKIDVLKVAHHGSSTSSSENFLNRILPDYAVISVGKNNSYGHPTNAVLSRLANLGSEIYRTDEHGSVLLGLTSSSKLVIFAFGTNTLPVKIQVWEIYVSGCLIMFYLTLSVNLKEKKTDKKRK